jgi:hypothetical protein
LNSALESIGVFDDRANLIVMSNNDKKIIFIGMHHLGRMEFYDSVASKVDSLQKIGYIVYYESIKKSTGIDSLSVEIYKKKFRKITGITGLQFYDTINKVFAGKYQYKGNYQLTNQPSYPKLNVDIQSAKNVDVELKDMINRYELKYDTIVLNECDMVAPIGSKTYECDLSDAKNVEKFRTEFIFGYRDQHLATVISNSLHDKIVVIYGKGHNEGLIRELQALDEYWQQTRVD